MNLWYSVSMANGVIVAAAALPPVNWWLEIGRILATAVIAFAAAVGGYFLADRGKKRDLLYKERFNSFKAVSNQLMEVRYYLYEIRGAAESILLGHTIVEGDLEFFKILNQANEKLDNIYPRITKTKFDWILLSIKTRASIELILRDMGELLIYSSYVHDYVRTDKPYVPKAGIKIIKVDLETLLVKTGVVIRKIELLLDEAYRDLDLPNFSPMFTEEEDLRPIVLPESLGPQEGITQPED